MKTTTLTETTAVDPRDGAVMILPAAVTKSRPSPSYDACY